MSGKAYKDKDSQWVAEKYLEGVDDIANAIDKVSHALTVFDMARDVAEDNGDPSAYVEQALVKLGEAMAFAYNYSKEYKEEAKSEPTE